MRRQKGNCAREYNWATLILGGYKCGDLALQVGGVSDETVKYGRELVTALARPRSNCTSKLQTRPLVREGATK
jgi:hypothetical protein